VNVPWSIRLDFVTRRNLMPDYITSVVALCPLYILLGRSSNDLFRGFGRYLDISQRMIFGPEVAAKQREPPNHPLLTDYHDIKGLQFRLLPWAGSGL
jgi:hypothetical protein